MSSVYTPLPAEVAATRAVLGPRVQRGLAFVDRIYPDWENRIDVDFLDVGDCSLCMIGQLDTEGNFNETRKRRHWRKQDLIDRGLLLFHEDEAKLDWLYEMLTHLWRSAIFERRERAADNDDQEQAAELLAA